MSNCTGCHNSFGDHPNPHSRECTICIRNPRYPTMKMPDKATIDGVEVTVPQDLYITEDRKKLDEKRMLKKLAEVANTINRRREHEKIIPLKRPKRLRPAYSPWEAYWDYVYCQ